MRKGIKELVEHLLPRLQVQLDRRGRGLILNNNLGEVESLSSRPEEDKLAKIYT